MARLLNKLILFFGVFIYFICFVSGSGFVETSGSDFILDGEAFYFAGTNAYYLWYGDIYCLAPLTNQGCVVPLLDDAQNLGLNVVRTWGFSNAAYKYGYCFQPSPGVYDENTFAHFDRVIKEAGDRDLKLIVVLVNNWDDFGGMTTYNSWCGVTNKDDFYTNVCTKQLYKDYVNYFLNRVNTITGVRYKDDPTIFAWELANEPRATSDITGVTLNNWIGEMSAYIKSIDSNHLVTTGVDGGYVDKGVGWWYQGGEGQNFYANHQWSTIDFATFHYYESMDSSIDPATWITEHIDDAHDVIGKPVIFEEFNGNMSARLIKLEEWYGLMEDNDINGDLFWMLADNYFVNNNDGYFIQCPENTAECELIRNHAVFMRNKTDPGSASGFTVRDIPVSGDYDYDGKEDIIAYRPTDATWHVRYSGGGEIVAQFGAPGDLPIPGDYDGDGFDDWAIFRSGDATWHVRYSSSGQIVRMQYGASTDIPIPGDYDGDGKDDLAIFRPNDATWHMRYSSSGQVVRWQYGASTDKPIPGDYDGDGTTDLAIFRPNDATWHVRYSSNGQIIRMQYGASTDIPIPGDYDGDGKADLAIFRPNDATWHIGYSGGGRLIVQHGIGSG